MLWKVYSWALGLVTGITLLQAVLGKTHITYEAIDYILIPITALQVVGLFGYAFRKPLLTSAIWRGLFWVFIIAFVASLITGGERFSAAQDVAFISGLISVSLPAFLLFGPLLLANYRYAFGCEDIWSSSRLAVAS